MTAIKDIFIIPRKNAKMGYIIYAPLQNVAFFGNKKTAELVNRYIQGNEISEEDRHTAVWRYLSEIRDIQVTLPRSKTVGSETCIVIILSQSCNLACTYCYAQEARSKKTLDKGKLRIAIDFALSKSSKTVDFIFIGGGEPLLNWGLLKYAIDYIFDARKKSTQINITVTTNATLLNDERINYLKEHGAYLGISYDILPRVQNIQRPFADMNHDSFDVVDAMIKKVDDAGILYNFRSTITKLNVNLMPEMVDFVKSNYKNVNKLHFEPVLSAEDNDEDFYKEFIESFMKARRVGLKNNIRVYNSISNSLDKLNSRFCRGEFCVTPDGDIVACHRISSKGEFAYGLVDYGYIGEQVNIDQDKKSKIYNIFNAKYECCSTCFAKWHCAGGCPTERLSQTPEQRISKCDFTKSLIASLLEDRLSN